MPIQAVIPLSPLSQADFRELDYLVMNHAFECHNDLGRFCDERVYQLDMGARLASAGFEIRREFRVAVTCQDFVKEYLLDMIVSKGAVYEIKHATHLTADHEAQLMNYLFLTQCHHGKLVNFSGRSVTSRFVNAVITPQNRRRYEMKMDEWNGSDEPSQRLLEALRLICAEWGMFLEARLYIEGLIHFLGGEANVSRPLPLIRNRLSLGTQKFHHLSDDTLFRLTAISDPSIHIRNDMKRLLALVPARRLHWINFNHHVVELTILQK